MRDEREKGQVEHSFFHPSSLIPHPCFSSLALYLPEVVLNVTARINNVHYFISVPANTGEANDSWTHLNC
jgi:hypothetical protein